MGIFKDFERDVIKTLVGRHMPMGKVEAVFASAVLVSYAYTEGGYFLTVRHPVIPSERVVCHQPLLIGKSGDATYGFVVFLEGGELTLECHAWGEEQVPEDMRERHVEIALAT